MSFHEVNLTIRGKNREEMRKALISVMLDEEAGSGRGEKCSHYQYNVETYQGYGIYLKRPTQLNKGFDFTVNVNGMYFKKNRRYSNPSHQDIFDALNSCKTNYPDKFNFVSDIILRLYNCEDVNFEKLQGVEFLDYEGKSHPIAIILLSIKWLFMEQDCAYWNYSGRNMFFSALKERMFV